MKSKVEKCILCIYFVLFAFSRSVVINLVKSLSSNLQKLIAANDAKLENIILDQAQILTGLNKINCIKYQHLSIEYIGYQKIGKKLKSWSDERNVSAQKLNQIQQEIVELKNDRELDNTV